MTTPQDRLKSPLTISDPGVDFLHAALASEDYLYSEDLLEDEDGLPHVIGLHGFAGSGKDTIADWFVKNRGYKRIAFADALRDGALALNPWIPMDGETDSTETYFKGQAVDLASLVNHYGWDYSKREFPAVRRILQVLGTEVGRKYGGEEIWINYLFDQLDPNTRYVIPDVRFENEVDAIRQWDSEAHVLFVLRPGYEPVNGHISDAGLSHELFDFGILNGSSIESLHDALSKIYPDPLGEDAVDDTPVRVFPMDSLGDAA